MCKITVQQFEKILEYDVVAKNACIEVEFYIDEDTDYCHCWLGKTVDREDKNRAVYWYGLVEDGSEGYDYNTAEEFINARVFRGKSIKELWDKVTIDSIDGCSVEYRLPHFL